MPIPDQYKPVVEGLLEATKMDRVHWQESAPGHFAVSFAEFSLEIGRYSDHEGDTLSVRLRDAQGEVIDCFYIDERQKDHDTLETLHSLARRRAYKIDHYLNQILQELESGHALGDAQDDEPPPWDDNEPPPAGRAPPSPGDRR